MGGLQIRTQNQATHQLSLREIVATPVGAVLGEIGLTEFHGQFGHTLNQRSKAERIHHGEHGEAPRIRCNGAEPQQLEFINSLNS
jgi:hypothetical protein